MTVRYPYGHPQIVGTYGFTSVVVVVFRIKSSNFFCYVDFEIPTCTENCSVIWWYRERLSKRHQYNMAEKSFKLGKDNIWRPITSFDPWWWVLRCSNHCLFCCMHSVGAFLYVNDLILYFKYIFMYGKILIVLENNFFYTFIRQFCLTDHLF